MTDLSTELEGPVGLSREAYDRFKDGLMSRRIVPGTTLTQAELSEVLGVSLSPLRNALKILESEGFVAILPRSGIRVHKPDMTVIKDTFQFRNIIEEAAIIKFAEMCPMDELKRLRDAHEALIEGVTDDDAASLEKQLGGVDRGFHEQIVGALDNPLIRAAYETNFDRIQLIRLDRYYLTALSVRKTMKEHLRVIDGLIDRDPERALDALTDHLAQAFHRAVGI